MKDHTARQQHRILYCGETRPRLCGDVIICTLTIHWETQEAYRMRCVSVALHEQSSDMVSSSACFSYESAQIRTILNQYY